MARILVHLGRDVIKEEMDDEEFYRLKSYLKFVLDEKSKNILY